jgi:hypothetical protein
MLLEHHLGYNNRVKTTNYFETCMTRPDRAIIKKEWIRQVIEFPESEQVQEDGRIRRWSRISKMGNRHLRVVLLPDGETVHNAFFDRRHKA